MDDKLQPKSEVNLELLQADYGNNKRQMENVHLRLKSDLAVCATDAEKAIGFRQERRDVCRYCKRPECIESMVDERFAKTEFEQIRVLIGYLKLYNMFSSEDFLLPNPDNIPSCQQAEDNITLLENEIRKRFDIPFFLYRDLFSYPANKTGGLTKSPYEVRLYLFVKLVQILPKFYSHIQDRLKSFERIYTGAVFASQEIPSFYKVIFGTVKDRNWNIFFEGLHPRMISALLNRYNESKPGSLECFFNQMGITTDELFERMDKYEVKNMEYFKVNSVSKAVCQKYSGYKIKKRFPVVHKYVMSMLDEK